MEGAGRAGEKAKRGFILEGTRTSVCEGRYVATSDSVGGDMSRGMLTNGWGRIGAAVAAR